MPKDKEFPGGFFVSRPRPEAPSWLKLRISIRVAEFQEYLATKSGDEWLRLDVKESKRTDDEGEPKLYAQADLWEATPQAERRKDGLPF
jgi:hypothetical protein